MKKFLILLAFLFSFTVFTPSVDADLTEYLRWIDGVKLEKEITSDKVLEDSNWTEWKEKIQAWVAQIIEKLIQALWLFAFIWMTYAWLKMILSQWWEEEIEKWKRQIQWSITALLLVFLVEPMVVGVFYWAWNEAGGKIFWLWTAIDQDMLYTSAQRWIYEIMWFIKYIQMFVAIAALSMLIMSALKTFFAQDKDDAIENQKKSIIWIVVWILTIIFSKMMIYYLLYNPETWEVWWDKNIIFAEIGWLTAYLLWFVWAIAVASIIYWWFLMVTSNWDTDQAWKWKSIVINIAIWSMIIFVSYSLVSLIVNSF